MKLYNSFTQDYGDDGDGDDDYDDDDKALIS